MFEVKASINARLYSRVEFIPIQCCIGGLRLFQSVDAYYVFRNTTYFRCAFHVLRLTAARVVGVRVAGKACVSPA